LLVLSHTDNHGGFGKLHDFVVDLRERLHAVWRKLDGADPRTNAHKLATSHAWMAFKASCLSSQAIQGALPICCLDTYSWNWVGICMRFVLQYLHVFACMPLPWELRLDVGKSTIGTVTKWLALMSRTKECPFLWPCLEMCYLRRRFKADRLYNGDKLTFYFDNIMLRMWNCLSWSRRTYHFFFFLRQWIFLSGWQRPAILAVNPSG